MSLKAFLFGEKMKSDFYEYAKSRLSYQSESGYLVWNGCVGRWSRLNGTQAGTIRADGYRVVRLGGKCHYAHRLVILLAFGDVPDCMEVDHKNGVRCDNRLENLRVCSRVINAQNIRKATVRSKTGSLGVSAYGDKFSAKIRKNKKQTYLGTYNSIKEAYDAYIAAKRVMHEGFVEAADESACKEPL